MLMGTAEPVPVAPTKPTVFVEDLPDSEKEAGVCRPQAHLRRCECLLTPPGLLVLFDPLQTAAPPGLENLGNTCYMNATIQVLRAVPELDNALTKYAYGGAL